MAGWDHNLMGQKQREQLVKMLPVSKSSVRIVGDIENKVELEHPVRWYFDVETMLEARYVDNDRDHYPCGRIVIGEVVSDKYDDIITTSDTAQAVQLLFDIIYPVRT